MVMVKWLYLRQKWLQRAKEAEEKFLTWLAVDFFVGTEIKPEYIKASDCKVGSGKIDGW